MKNTTKFAWLGAVALMLVLPTFAMADHRGRGGHDRGGVDVSIGLGFNFSNYSSDRVYYSRVYEEPVRVYTPAPVYYAPRPVYCPPPTVVYSAPPVIYAPAHVYYTEPCEPRAYYGQTRFYYRR